MLRRTSSMTALVWILTTVASVYGLHRCALWMEQRGWIYYRKRRGSSGGLSSAFLEIQAFLEPSKRHVLEIKRSEDVAVADDDSTDPPQWPIKPPRRP